MRAPRSKTLNFKILFILSVLLLPASLRADDVCSKSKKAWESVESYQCTYRAVTDHEGKKTESLMKYTYQKPGKIRMDIEKPRKGAVLIYNPEVSDKVKVRPYKSFGGMVLSFPLTSKRVSSDSGGTIDKSDLGHRMAEICGEKRDANEKTVFDENGFLRKIERRDTKGNIVESFEWKDLKINPALPANAFTDF